MAAELVTHLIGVIGAPVDVPWLEPAAGCGNFMTAARDAGVTHVHGYDIAPADVTVAQANFLDLDLTPLSNAVCVTNPPFGRNHSLSVPFFNHAADSCDLIAFIVPRSWRKWSVMNRLDRRFVKVADHDIDVSYVDRDGDLLSQSSQLNTVFQVWVKTGTDRVTQPNPAPVQHFEVVKPHEANVSLTIFGRGAGTVKTEFEPVANTTQMFIKANPKTVAALREVDLSPFYSQVAYIEALSRKEIDFALTAHSNKVTIPPDFLTTSTLHPHLAPTPLTLTQATRPLAVRALV